MKDSKLQSLLEKIRNREANFFDNFILVIITISSVLIGLETNHKLTQSYHTFFYFADLIVLYIFIFEVLFKWYAFYPKPWRYFSDPWNIFDFTIVLVSVLPLLFHGSINTEAVLILRVLRLARVFRVFRFISVLKPLQMLVTTLLRSLPSMGYVALLILILFYVYGVIGVSLFEATDPEHFGGLMISLLTLFQTVTGEGWPDLLSIQIEAGNTLMASIYYVSFIVIGSMIILNLFIGVIVSELENLKEIDARGKERLDFVGHIVILGWSSRINYLLEELIEANSNSKRRIITLLADKSKLEMEDYFRLHFKDKLKKQKSIYFVFRTGIAYEATDLKMMQIAKAQSVIILSQPGANPDIYVIKVLMAIYSLFKDIDNVPNITLPLLDSKNDEIVKILSKSNVNAVLVKDIIAKLIAQSSRQAGLSIVYDEILSFFGHEIYTKEFKEVTGKKFGSLLNCFNESTLIGVVFGSESGNSTVKVNPEADYILKDGDSLIAIAEDENSFQYIKNNEIYVLNEKMNFKRKQLKLKENFLILGGNEIIYSIIEQISSYIGRQSAFTIISDERYFKPKQRYLNEKYTDMIFKIHDKDTTSREILEQIDYSDYSSVIILSYLDSLSPEEADSFSIITLMYLHCIFDELNINKTIVTELLSNKNDDILFERDNDDFVISDKIDSLLLAQYQHNPHIKKIYEEILDEQGSEIYLKEASKYIELGNEYNCYELTAKCYENGDIFIGYKLCNKQIETRLKNGIEINPPKETKIIFSKFDKLIVISEIQYYENN